MKNAVSIAEVFSSSVTAAAKMALTIVLLSVWLSGCASVIGNSEAFYKDRPIRPINWREYLTD